jgi:hypothetical protein
LRRLCCLNRHRPVKIMSNDLLPLPDILAEPPKETDRAGVAAEVVATAEVVAAERNGRFLTEYPSGNSQPDTNGPPGTINRLNAMTQNDSPTAVPTPLADGLADVAVTVRQIESILQANGTLAPEVHFAVERIHDVAMALRMREVDGALCDTLEASIREVGDAIVRNDAAASRSMSAAALLCDLSRRIDQMIRRTAVAVSVLESTERPAGVATSKDPATGSNGASPRPMAYTIDIVVSDDDHAGSLPQPAFVNTALPEMQAAVEAKENVTAPAESVVLSIPSPMDESKEAAQSNDAEAETTAVERIAVETVGSEFAASAVTRATPPAAPFSPPPAEMNVAVPARPRVPPNDPLAALYSLSEEELIALFS